MDVLRTFEGELLTIALKFSRDILGQSTILIYFPVRMRDKTSIFMNYSNIEFSLVR